MMGSLDIGDNLLGWTALLMRLPANFAWYTGDIETDNTYEWNPFRVAF